jgi:hypothetical protein
MLGALDAASLKERLPIVYVLDRYNVPVEETVGRYAGLCPFHDDSNASLDVFGERLERWGCFACGAKGDVFDLLGRLAWPGESPPFAAVRAYAIQLIEELEEGGWSGPTTGIERGFDPERARAIVEFSAVRDLAAVQSFLAAKHDKGELRGVDAEWLRARWGVGSRLEEIVIPYWNRNGDLLTYKHRTAETKALSAVGSDFSGHLYGEWRDHDPDCAVLLTEGESDAWAADRVAGARFAVLAVPTGAMDLPGTRVEPLAGRSVTVAFDGDEAGRAGSHLWCEALLAVGADVTNLRLPDGADLASLGPDELSAALS